MSLEFELLEKLARLKYLEMVKEKIDDEIENKAMLMFSKAFDPNAEDKQLSNSVLIKRWIKELNEDVEKLQSELLEAEFSSGVEDIKSAVKQSAKRESDKE